MSKALQVVRREIRELIPPAVFFLLLFHMLAMVQAVARGQQGVTLLRSLTATIGALTVAKAILIVNALPWGRRYDGRPLATSILWKTLLFGLLTVLFHYLEEVLPHVRALGGFAAAHRHAMAEASPTRILVTQLWLWAAVLLYATLSEVVRRYGWARVKDELFHRAVQAGVPE
jgi:hypothetical protein